MAIKKYNLKVYTAIWKDDRHVIKSKKQGSSQYLYYHHISVQLMLYGQELERKFDFCKGDIEKTLCAFGVCCIVMLFLHESESKITFSLTMWKGAARSWFFS